MIPVLPALVREIGDVGISDSGMWVGLLIATYAITQFVCAPIVGSISDCVGRRPVLLASMLGLAFDYTLQAVAGSMAWLFIGRMLAGGLGASVTTANAFIADTCPPDQRGKYYGAIGAMFGLAFAIGPAVGGLLGEYSLRLPFWFAAALAATNFLFGLKHLPESLPPQRRTRWSEASLNPFTVMRMLTRDTLVSWIAVAVFFSSIAQRGLESVFVLYTEYRFDWSSSDNGWALALAGLMAIVFQGVFAGPVIARLGAERTSIAGAMLLAISFVGYAIAAGGPGIYAAIVIGSAGSIAGPALQSIVAGRTPTESQGKIQGAVTALICLTTIIAPLIFSAVIFPAVTSGHGEGDFPSLPFWVGSAVMLVSLAALTYAFARHHDRSAH